MKVKVVFYKTLEENPKSSNNYCILVRNGFEMVIDSNTTVKDFIYYVISNYCYDCVYDNICCEMVAFFKREYDIRFKLSSNKLNKSLIDIFKYKILKEKPIIMIDCPEYLGAGCWGESTGLRYYINSNESIHTHEPHVHVKTFSGEFEDRFNIITGELMETKESHNHLSEKSRKEAKDFIKQKNKQQFLLEQWNKHTNCQWIVDIELLKNTGAVKFIRK